MKRKEVSRKLDKEIAVYTDGSCVSGKGGYCAIIRNGKSQRILCGSVPNSTINRTELTAVIKGLSAVPCGSSVTVYTDSAYVERAINEGRLTAWQKNGWHRIRTGAPVQNADCWLELSRVIHDARLETKFVKLKAHKGHYFNDCADRLARQAARQRN